MTQYYLISVQRMTTSDEADLVASWSAVVAEEDLDKITMSDAAKITELSIKNAPVTNVRPMTEPEIAEWREAQS